MMLPSCTRQCRLGNVGRVRPWRSRQFASSSSSSLTKSWERNARLVKNTDVTNNYLEHIRETHDPALHVKTLEDEIRGTMGKALGKQGEKVLYFMRLMEQERVRHESLQSNDDDNGDDRLECVRLHNQYRREAVQARWELMVHRQAVGFIVNNHRFVHEKFPIGDALPEDNENKQDSTDVLKTAAKATTTTTTTTRTNLTGQRDWWDRIGRWR